MKSDLTIEEKLKLLPNDDKAYILGYIDKSINAYKFSHKKTKKIAKRASA